MAVNEMQAIFAVATVVFFILGLWPLALITLVILIAVSLTKSSEEKKRQKEEIENLKQRIHELENDR